MVENYDFYDHDNLPFNGLQPMSLNDTIGKTKRSWNIFKSLRIGSGVSTVIYEIQDALYTR